MTLLQQLSELEDLIFGFDLSAGSSDLGVAGSVETGHIINADNNFSEGGGGLNNQIGACCLFTGECRQLLPNDCTQQHGIPIGNGTRCNPQICLGFIFGTTGACCYRGGGCNETNAIFCSLSGGYYAGDGTTCGGVDCHNDVIPGACCCSTGCTTGFGGGCDITCTFVEGGNCSDCPPTEPTGACCQDPTSMCMVTVESACHGLFHEGIDCSFVGSCAHDFCGPTQAYCADQCNDGFHEPHVTNPHCCGEGTNVPNQFCACCFNVSGGFYYTCCCTHNDPPIGDVCES